MARQPVFVNLQYLFGFGLVRGNKPEAFGREGDPTFRAPAILLGGRF